MQTEPEAPFRESQIPAVITVFPSKGRPTWPSVATAEQFYNSAEYQPILKLRLESTKSDTVLVEGYSG
jgi:hypothetical protein